MLQHLPHWLGEAMRTVRAGSDRLTLATLGTASELPTLELTSPAFGDGDPIPVRFTADGEGISPPLAWGPEPETTRSLVLMVEDADAPAPIPLVHALLFDISPETRHIAEGAIGGHPRGDAEAGETGRNSYLRSGWLPPDPPTGHGVHHYAFQLFALDTPIDLTGHPGRTALVEAMTGHVVAAGMLTATYERR